MGAINVIREIRRSTRRRFNSEENIRIVVEGLRGEISVSELCRREDIAPAVYYRWSKAFLEAGMNGPTYIIHMPGPYGIYCDAPHVIKIDEIYSNRIMIHVVER